MNILGLGMTAFLGSVVFHLILWRFYLPRRQPRALFIIFSTLAVSLILATTIHPLWGWSIHTLSEGLYFALLYVPLMISYAITYTAIEGESPSGLIVRALEKAGQSGLERGHFEGLITNDRFLAGRIDGLLESGFVTEESGRLVITRRGVLFLTLFQLPRRGLGIRKEGG